MLETQSNGGDDRLMLCIRIEPLSIQGLLIADLRDCPVNVCQPVMAPSNQLRPGHFRIPGCTRQTQRMFAPIALPRLQGRHSAG